MSASGSVLVSAQAFRIGRPQSRMHMPRATALRRVLAPLRKALARHSSHVIGGLRRSFVTFRIGRP